MEEHKEIKSFIGVYVALKAVNNPSIHWGAAKFVLHSPCSELSPLRASPFIGL